jgi:hypothetical protein
MANAKRTQNSSKNSTRRQSMAARAGKAMRTRPIATAAVATGIASGLAAGIAGFLAFRKSGKSFSQFSDDLATGLRDRAASARDRVKDGIADVTAKAKDLSEPRRDGIDDTRTQAEIAEEALTTKQIGKKTRRPVDPVVEEELKTGAITH